MKLLIDENISYRIVAKLKDIFPFSNHVKTLGLAQKDDIDIWHFAKKEKFTIVTNDSDFNDISLLYGFPPKIIWLRTGNHSTNIILTLLLENKEKILAAFNPFLNLPAYFLR